MCPFQAIGSIELDEKLYPYFQSNQEEITLLIIGTSITALKVYESMLIHLYSMHNNAFKYKIVFDIFNPTLKEKNKFDIIINLGTDSEGDFNIPLKYTPPIFNYEGIQANKYNRVANGGTFDHLHAGHKILLTISLFSVKEHLTIGITGENLLQNKKFKSYMQSYKTRQRCVSEFCQQIRPEIEIYFSELQEPAGPTKDGIYDALILTEETEKSLEYINNLRKEKNLNSLEGYVISLIGQKELQHVSIENKISSTQLREQISIRNRLESSEFLELKTQWMSISNDLFWFESIIVDYYSQPQRHYHTLRHIYDMLKQLKDAKNQTLVKLCTFFHDIIYYPKLHDNEEKSVLLFEEYANEMNFDPTIGKIFILQTKTHSNDVSYLSEDDLNDLMIFLDADLSILESDQYPIYAHDIRNEYQHYQDKEYKTGRIHVLQQFLQRKQIFYFRSDDKARNNIQEEISVLSTWHEEIN